MEELDLHIRETWKSAFKIMLVITLFVALFYFSYRIADIFAMIAVALLVVYTIVPLVNLLVKHGVGHKLAAVISFFILLAVIGIAGALVVPNLYREISSLTRFVNRDLLISIESLILKAEDFLRNYYIGIRLSSILEQLPSSLQASTKQVTELVLGIFTGAWNLFFTLLMVFFFLQDLENIKQNITRLFPSRYRHHITEGIVLVDQKVGAFLRGNLVRCTVVGILNGVLLALFGMPFAVSLGIISGIFNIIPFIGPLVGAVPGVLISLAGSTPHPLLVIVIYIITQAVDNIFLIPYLLGKAVDLRPITVVISLLIGGKLLGFLGMLLAIPVAAILKVLLEVYYFNNGITPPSANKKTTRN